MGQHLRAPKNAIRLEVQIIGRFRISLQQIVDRGECVVLFGLDLLKPQFFQPLPLLMLPLPGEPGGIGLLAFDHDKGPVDPLPSEHQACEVPAALANGALGARAGVVIVVGQIAPGITAGPQRVPGGIFAQLFIRRGRPVDPDVKTRARGKLRPRAIGVAFERIHIAVGFVDAPVFKIRSGKIALPVPLQSICAHKASSHLSVWIVLVCLIIS